jgi:hypothetical protein
VLTAEHCVPGAISKASIAIVRTTGGNLASERTAVTAIVRHPSADVALVRTA